MPDPLPMHMACTAMLSLCATLCVYVAMDSLASLCSLLLCRCFALSCRSLPLTNNSHAYSRLGTRQNGVFPRLWRFPLAVRHKCTVHILANCKCTSKLIPIVHGSKGASAVVDSCVAGCVDGASAAAEMCGCCGL